MTRIKAVSLLASLVALTIAVFLPFFGEWAQGAFFMALAALLRVQSEAA